MVIHYFRKVISQYADFKGRARRAEYWYFFLAIMIVVFALSFLTGFLSALSTTLGGLFGIVLVIFYIGILVPALAVGVRRMHDVGKSGWFLLIPIYSLILTVTEGERGPNQYGPDPKAAENSSVNQY
jgi:uncharacterized membrane protein YhaH (DUF805 family)